jgi:nucleotide-binding universal stress UspA family protein
MKNILVPTDLTACTEKTLEYAIMLAAKSSSKLFFYHISEKQKQDFSNFFISCIKKKIENLKIDLNLLQTEFIIETGSFSNDHIKRIIKKHKINMLVIEASHEGHNTTFFGSYVSDLINEISCPVLSVPYGSGEFKIEHIGFAAELFDLPKRIKTIIPFAKLFNADIEAFHIYPVFPQEVDVEKYDVGKVLGKIKRENDYENISIQFIKTAFDNEPVIGIRKYISTAKPDLLVMFHKPRGLFDKLFLDEGATPTVLKTSEVPVLAFNKKSSLKIM